MFAQVSAACVGFGVWLVLPPPMCIALLTAAAAIVYNLRRVKAFSNGFLRQSSNVGVVVIAILVGIAVKNLLKEGIDDGCVQRAGLVQMVNVLFIGVSSWMFRYRVVFAIRWASVVQSLCAAVCVFGRLIGVVPAPSRALEWPLICRPDGFEETAVVALVSTVAIIMTIPRVHALLRDVFFTQPLAEAVLQLDREEHDDGSSASSVTALTDLSMVSSDDFCVSLPTPVVQHEELQPMFLQQTEPIVERKGIDWSLWRVNLRSVAARYARHHVAMNEWIAMRQASKDEGNYLALFSVDLLRKVAKHVQDSVARDFEQHAMNRQASHRLEIFRFPAFD